MRHLLRPALLSVCMAACALAQADWTTATELPGVELKGLSAAQVKQVLQILRDESCTCGCGMKLAECRIQDPKCGDSRSLTYIAIEGVRNRRTAKQIHDDIVNSPVAKMRASQNRILGDPVEIPIAGAPARGPANARITIVEFSDFQCPYCVQVVPEISAVLKAHAGDVRLVFKQYPLNIHDEAMPAAEAALAAHAQGKFWEMYDKLFAFHGRLSREKIFDAAKQVGLDMTRFTHDMESHIWAKQVEKDIADGDRAGVTGTPTFYLNGKPYRGSMDLPSIEPLLKDELKIAPVRASNAR